MLIAAVVVATCLVAWILYDNFIRKPANFPPGTTTWVSGLSSIV